jgi:N,N-dimethylformamidase
MPTNTWQAYNFYDGDGDGYGDSWYVSWAIHSLDETRPHLHRGVPYRFRSYDLQFLHWLARNGHDADFLSDEELEGCPTGDALRAAYDLVVFPGHTEYVTAHAYDVTTRYRDLGGSLIFLSANNFFRRVDRSGDSIRLVDLWRDLGRPEAQLAGVQYRASDRGTHQSPFVVTDAGAASWIFAGTGLASGSTFGRYGIEIDATTPESPPGTQVLAQIPDALGPGLTAQMTYYETPAGAKVFAAGALNFGGQLMLWPQPQQILANLWARLAP